MTHVEKLVRRVARQAEKILRQEERQAFEEFRKAYVLRGECFSNGAIADLVNGGADERTFTHLKRCRECRQRLAILGIPDIGHKPVPLVLQRRIIEVQNGKIPNSASMAFEVVPCFDPKRWDLERAVNEFHLDGALQSSSAGSMVRAETHNTIFFTDVEFSRRLRRGLQNHYGVIDQIRISGPLTEGSFLGITDIEFRTSTLLS